MSEPAIIATGPRQALRRRPALDGVDLAAQEGTVLGLLGPNGAGKTTARAHPRHPARARRGHAPGRGLDVVKDAASCAPGSASPASTRRSTRTSPASRTSRWSAGSTTSASARRAAGARRLLERFELADAGDRPRKTYSGGMRRRLDLAAALVARPPVLFLDEPTTGLDPRSRLGCGRRSSDASPTGTTVLLTTQYLEEADRLADHIAVIDHGRVIAEGTSDELKDRVGGERLEVTLGEADAERRGRRARRGDEPPRAEGAP